MKLPDQGRWRRNTGEGIPRSRSISFHSRATASTQKPTVKQPTAAGGAISSDPGRTTLNFTSDSSLGAEPPVVVGTTFAVKYRLEGVLGRGAMGVVYLAHDLSLEREVAVKILLPAHAVVAGIVDSFHREAVAMASIRHINVVQIYTCGQHDGLHFFVMEYVPGHSVAALIQKFFGCGETLPLETLLGILDQAALGLTAMHQRGIFHGDVKPANMLIDERNHVAIADFGLVGSSTAVNDAAESAEVNPRNISGGTPLYLAPELIAGRTVPPEERHLCDEYSLGVSVFEMFTGQGPFENGTVENILKGHLFAPPPKLTKLRPDLPFALNPVIQRALAKQPRLRYPSCADLAFAVNRAVQDQAA